MAEPGTFPTPITKKYVAVHFFGKRATRCGPAVKTAPKNGTKPACAGSHRVHGGGLRASLSREFIRRGTQAEILESNKVFDRMNRIDRIQPHPVYPVNPV